MKISFKFGMLLLSSFLVLTACGGGGSSSTPVSLTTTINSFSIVGTSASNAGDPVPINANVNGGNFEVSWDVSSSDAYHVEMYISDDATLDTNTDINILGKNCGSNATFYECSKTANFSCKFKTTNLISCGPISVANTEVDLMTYLSTLPKAAYFILDACNGLLTSCKTQAVEVVFQ
jgi:hypothetical protein